VREDCLTVVVIVSWEDCLTVGVIVSSGGLFDRGSDSSE